MVDPESKMVSKKKNKCMQLSSRIYVITKLEVEKEVWLELLATTTHFNITIHKKWEICHLHGRHRNRNYFRFPCSNPEGTGRCKEGQFCSNLKTHSCLNDTASTVTTDSVSSIRCLGLSRQGEERPSTPRPENDFTINDRQT